MCRPKQNLLLRIILFMRKHTETEHRDRGGRRKKFIQNSIYVFLSSGRSKD